MHNLIQKDCPASRTFLTGQESSKGYFSILSRNVSRRNKNWPHDGKKITNIYFGNTNIYFEPSVFVSQGLNKWYITELKVMCVDMNVRAYSLWVWDFDISFKSRIISSKWRKWENFTHKICYTSTTILLLYIYITDLCKIHLKSIVVHSICALSYI